MEDNEKIILTEVKNLCRILAGDMFRKKGTLVFYNNFYNKVLSL